MRATWYMLEDGTPVDPNEVTRDDNGDLVHKSGKVARGDHGNFRTTGVDVDDRTGKPLAGGKQDHDGVPESKTKGKAKEAKPDDAKGGGYKTRESKVD